MGSISMVPGVCKTVSQCSGDTLIFQCCWLKIVPHNTFYIFPSVRDFITKFDLGGILVLLPHLVTGLGGRGLLHFLFFSRQMPILFIAEDIRALED